MQIHIWQRASSIYAHSPLLLTCIQCTCSSGISHFRRDERQWGSGGPLLPWKPPASCCATLAAGGPPVSRPVRCTGIHEPPRFQPTPERNWRQTQKQQVFTGQVPASSHKMTWIRKLKRVLCSFGELIQTANFNEVVIQNQKYASFP